MAKDGMTLTGDRELERLLLKLPEKVQARPLKKGIRFAGKPIRKSQRDGIKKYNQTKTLQKSIGTRLKTYRSSGNTVLVIGPRIDFLVSVQGIDDAKTARKQGFTRVRYLNPPQDAAKYGLGIERGWRGRVPDPFMRRSFEKGKRTVLGDFKRGIGNGIEIEAARLAKKKL